MMISHTNSNRAFSHKGLIWIFQQLPPGYTSQWQLHGTAPYSQYNYIVITLPLITNTDLTRSEHPGQTPSSPASVSCHMGNAAPDLWKLEQRPAEWEGFPQRWREAEYWVIYGRFPPRENLSCHIGAFFCLVGLFLQLV